MQCGQCGVDIGGGIYNGDVLMMVVFTLVVLMMVVSAWLGAERGGKVRRGIYSAATHSIALGLYFIFISIM